MPNSPSTNRDHPLIPTPDSSAASTPSEENESNTSSIHIKLPSQHTLTYTPDNFSSCTILQLKTWVASQLVQLYRQEFPNENDNSDSSDSTNPIAQYRNPTDASVRLIFRGKFLDNNSRTLQDYKLEDGDAVHCVVSREGQGHHLRYERVLRERVQQNQHRRSHSNQLNTDSSQDSQQPLLRDDTDQDDSEVADRAAPDDDTPRGFDQLREAGIPEDEIQEMRSQFYGARPDVLRRLQSRELTLREVHEMEEEWMQEVNADGGGALLTQNDSQNQRVYYEFEYMGTNYQMALGIFMGFLFGVFMLIWVLDGSVSFKFKYGLFVGLCSNFLLTLAGGFFA